MIKNIIIFILILAFIAVIVFFDLPGVQKTLNLREQLKEGEEELSEKQVLLAKIEKLLKDYEESQEDLKKVSYILPSGQDIANLIVQLEALAFEGGLVLDAIEFSPVEKQEVSRDAQMSSPEEVVVRKYQTLKVNLKLIGDYSAFKTFLGLVEENIRLMDITSIDFSIQAGEESQLFNLNLNLNTYYQ